MRIQYKILLLFLVVATVPFIVIQLFISSSVSSELRVRLSERLQSENHREGAELSYFLSKYKSETLAFAKLPAVKNLSSVIGSGGVLGAGERVAQLEEEVIQIFSAFISEQDEIAQIRFLDIKGHEIVRVDNGDDGPVVISNQDLQDKGGKAYFQKGIWADENSVYISDLDLNMEHGKIQRPYMPVSRYTAPVYHEGKAAGVIVVNINADSILDQVVLGDSEVVIIDQDGYYISGVGEQRRFSKQLTGDNYFTESGGLIENDIRKNLLSGNFFNTYKQTHVFWTRVLLDVDDQRSLIVLSSATEDAISALVNDFNKTLILVSFITIIGLFILSYVFSSTISRPIRKLKDVTDSLFKGNFDSRSTIHSNDEFGALSESFNQMAENIKESHFNLEQKVIKRTHTLNEHKKDLEDQQRAILNILEDINADKERISYLVDDLEKFKLAVENTSDHVVITDKEGVIIYANQSVERITGYAQEEVLNKKVGTSELWGGLMDEDFYKKMWHTISEDKDTFTSQVKNKRKNGQEYFSYVTISPIVDDNNEVKFFVNIERDVTKEHEIDKAKTEFVSLASHQLRTPLSAIRWYSEMMAETKSLDDEQKEYLKEIHHGAKRMIDLVGALLSVSRLELGTTIVQLEPVDLGIVAQNAAKDLHVATLEHGIKMNLDIMKNTPAIQADAKLVRIIIENLLTNAIKYTRKDGNVTLSLRKVAVGKVFGGRKMSSEVIGISVVDTGVGIPENQQDKIFHKLFRADNVRDIDTNGTGLGLYLVKLSVERMGGEIWFQSIEGEGTTFNFFLPIEHVSIDVPLQS